MISIIIPVYNVIAYLDACIQSVAQQEYSDFECLLIDDGSTDGSGERCDLWSKKDTRIKVFHQTNQGVSTARNNGLKEAQGTYITFIDSDDWVEPTYLSAMLQNMEETKADLVVSGLYQEFKDGKSINYSPHQTICFELTEENIEHFIRLNKKYLLFAPYIKLYKRSIINKYHIAFDSQTAYGEDLQFNYQYLNHVQTLSCIQESNYHYRIIGEGTLSSKLRPDQFETDYQQWKVLAAFYQQRNLWNSLSQEYLYNRLWGIIVDGIFLFPRLTKRSISYLRDILSIPEINDLHHFYQHYSCSDWIKRAILHRRSLLFYTYFKLYGKK